jgi:hypothetical protein
VHLGLVNGEQLLTNDWGGNGYAARVLSNGVKSDGKHFSRELILVPSDDELMVHLHGARYLKVYFPTNEDFRGSINFELIDLRHRSALDPNTWLGVLDANDTYGAIKEVKACVVRHLGPASRQAQAQFDFETDLRVWIGELSSQRPGLFEDGKRYGEFYCSIKQQFPYDEKLLYVGNVNQAVVYAAARWARQQFANSQEAERSPLMTVDEITLRDGMMAVADKHLCPGWPGHPRTES